MKRNSFVISRMIRLYCLLPALMWLALSPVAAQPIVIDEVVAVIGDKRVLYSEIEENLIQLKAQGSVTNAGSRCDILEQLMVQKLLVNQAEIDSILVTDGQVEMEMEQRMRYFVNQIGSEEKLEGYFGKSIIEIKEELRGEVRDQMLTNNMRGTITSGLEVTPSEVRTYYRNMPEDSIPIIDSEIEFNQVAVYPKSSSEAIFAAREKLLDLRERVLNGESFYTLAVINSEDQGSAIRGGDIGWFARSELDAEYAKVAFALKPGAISKIVESSFGYHLIQMIEKTDDRVHTRHILIRPKIDPEDRIQAIGKLDSLIRLVRQDSLTFDEVARLHSEDEDSRINGGQMVNPMRGGARWRMDEFDQTEYEIISELKTGEISEPYETTDDNGKTVYKAIWVKNRTEPHVANLKDDYNVFKEGALAAKENEVVNKWIEEKIGSTYIRISDQYGTCPMELNGWPLGGMASND